MKGIPITKLTIGLMCLVGLIWIFLDSDERVEREKKLLRESGEFTTGFVTEIKYGYKGQKYIHYTFTVDEQQIKGHRRYYESDGSFEVGDECIVIYYLNDPKLNLIVYHHDPYK